MSELVVTEVSAQYLHCAEAFRSSIAEWESAQNRLMGRARFLEALNNHMGVVTEELQAAASSMEASTQRGDVFGEAEIERAIRLGREGESVKHLMEEIHSQLDAIQMDSRGKQNMVRQAEIDWDAALAAVETAGGLQ
jgi:hypothetical protein